MIFVGVSLIVSPVLDVSQMLQWTKMCHDRRAVVMVKGWLVFSHQNPEPPKAPETAHDHYQVLLGAVGNFEVRISGFPRHFG